MSRPMVFAPSSYQQHFHGGGGGGGGGCGGDGGVFAGQGQDAAFASMLYGSRVPYQHAPYQQAQHLQVQGHHQAPVPVALSTPMGGRGQAAQQQQQQQQTVLTFRPADLPGPAPANSSPRADSVPHSHSHPHTHSLAHPHYSFSHLSSQPHPHPHPQPQPQPHSLSHPHTLLPPQSRPGFHDAHLPVVTHPPQPPPLHHPQPAPQHHSMASDTNQDAYMASEEELAQLQKLSNEYEPELSGPLISERQPTGKITTEYANADPIYRAKTASLPQRYSEYRTCRGDGHCGWRAIAFTYFEALQRLGDKHKFLEEVARLTSLKNLLNTVGFQEELYEDFAEETFDLLRSTGAALPVVDNGASLLASFNDQGISMAIITHLKLLTSAWIQTHPDDFAPFILGQDIKQYCSSEIEPSICELDNVGLIALIEVLIKPAGIALEVSYLDRSQGDETNNYRYDPDSLTVQDVVPVIRLLYRPGHYDILYKPEDFAPPPAMPLPVPVQSNVYVGLAGSTADYMPQDLPTSRAIPELMTMIPGATSAGFAFNQPTWSSSFDFAASPAFPALAMAPLNYTPVQQQVPPPSTVPSPQEYPAPPQEFPTAAPREFIQSSPNEYASPQEYPARNGSVSMDSPVSMSINRPLTVQRGEPFRPSIYEFEPHYGATQPHHMPCQTSIFRNSHFNTAHYMNPDFQPEEWTPDQEYVLSHRSRNKSTSQ